MKNKVAQNDEAIAFDEKAKIVVEEAKRIKALKDTDRPKYDKIVAKLQEAVSEKANTRVGHMAQSALEELQIDSTEGLTVEEREEINGVFRAEDENTYMGDSERFISIEDAQRNGELIDETL